MAKSFKMARVFKDNNTVPIDTMMSGYNRYACWSLVIAELDFFQKTFFTRSFV